MKSTENKVKITKKNTTTTFKIKLQLNQTIFQINKTKLNYIPNNFQQTYLSSFN